MSTNSTTTFIYEIIKQELLLDVADDIHRNWQLTCGYNERLKDKANDKDMNNEWILIGKEDIVKLPNRSLSKKNRQENDAAAFAAIKAVLTAERNIFCSSTFQKFASASVDVHNDWCLRNKKESYNADQHVDFYQLSLLNQKKDLDHVLIATKAIHNIRHKYMENDLSRLFLVF